MMTPTLILEAPLFTPSLLQTNRFAARPLTNAQLRLGLDTIAANWQESGLALSALPPLLDLTHRYRAFAASPDWRESARAHPIARQLLQDPLTQAMFHRPTADAPEAELLDLALAHPSTRHRVAQATPLGLKVRLFTHELETAVALRERRRIMAHAIDDTISKTPKAAILMLGCGHFRALELSMRAGEAGRILAIDPRDACLEVVRSQNASITPIETLCEAPGRMIARPLRFGRFDLILVPGLLDGMEDPAAGRMIAALASALRPGGQILVAAMARGIRCDGYLDAFMDWQPVLRGEEDMQALMQHAQGSDIASRVVFHGSNSAMLYGTARRRG
jgi:2-polyprenyl-3-methyl-5-hydroxy-6-metoxy-1,4-benzoquinol methylase